MARSAVVRPFMGDGRNSYQDNESRFPSKGQAQPCVICGRAVKDPLNARWLTVGDGGDRFLTPAEVEAGAAQQPGFMGCFPIGPECLKKHGAALSTFLPGAAAIHATLPTEPDNSNARRNETAPGDAEENATRARGVVTTGGGA